MRTRPYTIAFLAALSAHALGSPLGFRTIDIRRDSVIEVVADQDLNVGSAREGDRFSATVTDGRDLPRGTQLVGEIVRVEPKSRDRSAFVDLEFRSLLLPDGSRHSIEALPISLDNRNVQRTRDGRLVANGRKVRSEYYVGGGLLGGLLVGTLVKKPFEGAFLGTLAGILLAEAEKNRDKGDVVLRRGSKLGAVFLRDVSIDDRDRWDREDRDLRDGRFDVRVGRRSIPFERGREPYRNGGVTLVPLNAFARDLDFQIDREGDRLFLDSDRGSIRGRIGSPEIRFRGRSLDLGAPIENREGVLYVPIELLTLLTEETIAIDGTPVRRPA